MINLACGTKSLSPPESFSLWIVLMSRTPEPNLKFEKGKIINRKKIIIGSVGGCKVQFRFSWCVESTV